MTVSVQREPTLSDILQPIRESREQRELTLGDILRSILDGSRKRREQSQMDREAQEAIEGRRTPASYHQCGIHCTCSDEICVAHD
jgi:hypothetical protein